MAKEIKDRAKYLPEKSDQSIAPKTFAFIHSVDTDSFRKSIIEFVDSALNRDDISGDDKERLRDLGADFEVFSKIITPKNAEFIIRHAHHKTVSDAFFIGLMLGQNRISTEILRRFDSRKASLMRDAKRERDEEKSARLKKAILLTFNEVPLVDDWKVVESFREEICRQVGVEINARGYSTLTLQREIRIILKERTSS